MSWKNKNKLKGKNRYYSISKKLLRLGLPERYIFQNGNYYIG